MGRNSSYTDKIAATIIKKISGGESLRDICKAPDMPDRAAVFRWLAKDQYIDFRNQYMRAREAWADAVFDECMDIADDCEQTSEGIAKANVRINTRKWTLGKLKPKKYGEKIKVVGDADEPLAVVTSFDVSGLSADVLRAIKEAAKPDADNTD